MKWLPFLWDTKGARSRKADVDSLGERRHNLQQAFLIYTNVSVVVEKNTRDSCHIVTIFVLFSRRKNRCSRWRQNNHYSDAMVHLRFLTHRTRRGVKKASEGHLTECLIALRNSESDSHEKKESSKSKEVSDHDKRNGFLFLCRMFASRSLLGKDKDFWWWLIQNTVQFCGHTKPSQLMWQV